MLLKINRCPVERKKMRKNNLKMKALFYIVLPFMFFFTMFMQLSAEPLVIKGVDGTWLPVLVSSWTEKNNGVFLKPIKNIDPQILRTKLLDKFPDMNIEIINEGIFFPSINTETLFSIVGGVDIGLNRPSESKTLWENPDIKILKKNQEKEPLTGEEVIEAKVNEVSFDEKKGEMHIAITITERASKGKFRRYFGRQLIKVVFNMNNGVVDKNDPHNQKFGKLLLLKEGSSFSFIPKKTDPSKAFIISEYYIINL